MLALPGDTVGIDACEGFRGQLALRFGLAQTLGGGSEAVARLVFVLSLAGGGLLHGGQRLRVFIGAVGLLAGLRKQHIPARPVAGQRRPVLVRGQPLFAIVLLVGEGLLLRFACGQGGACRGVGLGCGVAGAGSLGDGRLQRFQARIEYFRLVQQRHRVLLRAFGRGQRGAGLMDIAAQHFQCQASAFSFLLCEGNRRLRGGAFGCKANHFIVQCARRLHGIQLRQHGAARRCGVGIVLPLPEMFACLLCRCGQSFGLLVPAQFGFQRCDAPGRGVQRYFGGFGLGDDCGTLIRRQRLLVRQARAEGLQSQFLGAPAFKSTL